MYSLREVSGMSQKHPVQLLVNKSRTQPLLYQPGSTPHADRPSGQGAVPAHGALLPPSHENGPAAEGGAVVCQEDRARRQRRGQNYSLSCPWQAELAGNPHFIIRTVVHDIIGGGKLIMIAHLFALHRAQAAFLVPM